MAEDTPHVRDAVKLNLVLERLDQAMHLLHEEAQRTRAERELLTQTNKTLISFLDHFSEHRDRSELSLAAAARLEAELRESVAQVHRAIDKLPGKRHQ